jgi:hypothetical protein
MTINFAEHFLLSASGHVGSVSMCLAILELFGLLGKPSRRAVPKS